MPPTKLSLVRACMAAGDWEGALRIAHKFPRLGKFRREVTRAWDSLMNPSFYDQIGKNPEDLVKEGIAALKEMYGDR